jgi:hypothetical protein
VTTGPLSQLFLEKPSNDLRQGDICYDWPVPRWLLNSYQITAEPGTTRNLNAVLSLQAKGESLPLIICSHDCDLDNPRNRLGFLVAPLLHWPGWPNPEMASDASLRMISSAVSAADGSYEFINIFPIKIPSEPPDWRVVDYSSMMSISPPEKLVPVLKAHKRYEMTDEGRVSFANKLAAFFIRNN